MRQEHRSGAARADRRFDDLLDDEVLVVDPGRTSKSSELLRPETAVASGLVQRRARDGVGVAAGADAAVAAATASSTGAPLPSGLRQKFEGSLGADLGGVRVHTGESSAAANDAVGAKAFTIGQDIHFAAGQYDPSTRAGEHLLAHEVAHTVQQSGGAAKLQHKLAVSSPGDSLEHEADRAADAMVQGAPVAVGGASGSNVAMRKASGYIAGALPSVGSEDGSIEVKMPDIEIAKRRSKSKAWTLLKEKHDIRVVPDIDIAIGPVKAKLRVDVKPRASAMVAAGVGPVKVNNIYVRLNLKDMSPSQLAKLGVGAGHDAANELSPLANSQNKHKNADAAALEIAQSGHHVAHGQIDAPADVSATIQGSAAAEASIRDGISGQLGVGVGGGLSAIGTARAKANAGVGLTFSYDGGDPDLEADLHFDFATRLAFGLSGFIYGFFELTADKDNKDGAHPPVPGGKSDGIFTKPPLWPKELDWLIPDLFKEPKGPDGAFRVEWKKTFPIISKELEKQWHLKASAHIDANSLSDFELDKPEVDVAAVIQDYVAPLLLANDEIPQTDEQVKEQGKKKVEAELKKAAASAKRAVRAATEAFDAKRGFANQERSWIDERLANVPESKQGPLRRYQQAVQKLSGQLDKLQEVPPWLQKDWDVAKAEGDKAEEAAKRHAISEFKALTENAEHFIEHLEGLFTAKRPVVEDDEGDGPKEATPKELARLAVAEFKILGVMRKLAARETFRVSGGLMDFEIFMQAWEVDHEWHKDKFRDVLPANHEWFPCSQIPDYIGTDAANFVHGADWASMVVDLANDLRTLTKYMVFDPGKASKVQDGKIILQGHPGSPVFFAGKHQATGHPAFDAELKSCFHQGVQLVPCLQAMERIANQWIWAGANPERVHPDMTSDRKGTKLDVAELARVQRIQHENISLMFHLQIARFA